MISNKPTSYYLEKLWLGFTLRCPNCGKGEMFNGLFKMIPTCSNCHVRYERLSGESVGGMYINLVFAELLSIGGFFITQLLFSPPMWFQIVFWVTFNILFVVLFYRHSRAMWVAISFLTMGVYPDPDYKPESNDTPSKS